jgi:hypothetical protein
MQGRLARDVLGWGFGLWLIGYLLGLAFFAVVPASQIGWYVMPLALAVTCFVLWRRIAIGSIRDGVLIGIGWTAIAVACDYIFIVKLFNPPDGYYKPDVYLYYLSTLLLPIGAAWLRR